MRLGFGPQGWDFGLETGIWAWNLEFGQNWVEVNKIVRMWPNLAKFFLNLIKFDRIWSSLVKFAQFCSNLAEFDGIWVLSLGGWM